MKKTRVVWSNADRDIFNAALYAMVINHYDSNLINQICNQVTGDSSTRITGLTDLALAAQKNLPSYKRKTRCAFACEMPKIKNDLIEIFTGGKVAKSDPVVVKTNNQSLVDYVKSLKELGLNTDNINTAAAKFLAA